MLELGQVDMVYQRSPAASKSVFSFVYKNGPKLDLIKTSRREMAIETFENAYTDVMEGNLSLRQAAKTYGTDKMSLMRYIKKERCRPR